MDPLSKYNQARCNAMVKALSARHFYLKGLWENSAGDPDADPGTWEHFQAVVPPYFTIWARYRPDIRL